MESSSVKFFTWMESRWCEVDAHTGDIQSKRHKPRFVYLRRGRLHVVRTSSVLRGLRALAAGRPTTVRDGPQVSQRSVKSLEEAREQRRKELRDAKEGCKHCQDHHVCQLDPKNNNVVAKENALTNTVFKTPVGKVDVSVQVDPPWAQKKSTVSLNWGIKPGHKKLTNKTLKRKRYTILSDSDKSEPERAATKSNANLQEAKIARVQLTPIKNIKKISKESRNRLMAFKKLRLKREETVNRNSVLDKSRKNKKPPIKSGASKVDRVKNNLFTSRDSIYSESTDVVSAKRTKSDSKDANRKAAKDVDSVLSLSSADFQQSKSMRDVEANKDAKQGTSDNNLITEISMENIQETRLRKRRTLDVFTGEGPSPNKRSLRSAETGVTPKTDVKNTAVKENASKVDKGATQKIFFDKIQNKTRTRNNTLRDSLDVFVDSGKAESKTTRSQSTSSQSRHSFSSCEERENSEESDSTSVSGEVKSKMTRSQSLANKRVERILPNSDSSVFLSDGEVDAERSKVTRSQSKKKKSQLDSSNKLNVPANKVSKKSRKRMWNNYNKRQPKLNTSSDESDNDKRSLYVSAGSSVEANQIDREKEGHSSPEQYKELIVGQGDVDVLRKFLINTNDSFDVVKFDMDEDYKRSIFYLINPVVYLERCEVMEKMLRPQRLSKDYFAAQLGLRSVSEASALRHSSRLRNRTNCESSEPLQENLSLNRNRTQQKKKEIKKRTTASLREQLFRNRKGNQKEAENHQKGKTIAKDRVNRHKENRSLQRERDTERDRDQDPSEKALTARTLRDRNVRREKNVNDSDRPLSLTTAGKGSSQDLKKTRLLVNKLKKTLNAPKTAHALKEYSPMEDQAIVAWVSVGGRARLVNGNRVWRDLQEQYPRITNKVRTWQSLRNRYLRSILPALGRLAIPPADAARLRAAAATGTNTMPLTRSASSRGTVHLKLRAVAPAAPAAPRGKPKGVQHRAAAGELKGKRDSRRNSIFKEPQMGASSRRPRPLSDSEEDSSEKSSSEEPPQKRLRTTPRKPSPAKESVSHISRESNRRILESTSPSRGSGPFAQSAPTRRSNPSPPKKKTRKLFNPNSMI